MFLSFSAGKKEARSCRGLELVVADERDVEKCRELV